MTVKIEGMDALMRKLKNVEQMQRKLRPPMVKATSLLSDEMAHYPPKPAHSTYRRTTRLGSSWTTRIIQLANGIRGEVGNITPYAPWVQEWRRQRGFHKATGWITDRTAIKKVTPRINAIFKRTIDRELAK